MQASVGTSRYVEHYEFVTYLQEELYNVGKKNTRDYLVPKRGQKLYMINCFQLLWSLHSTLMFVHILYMQSDGTWY